MSANLGQKRKVSLTRSPLPKARGAKCRGGLETSTDRAFRRKGLERGVSHGLSLSGPLLPTGISTGAAL